MNLKINDDIIEVDGIIYKREIKSKNILFKTEDGVDIFEGDEYFRVFNTSLDLYEYKTFATKEYNFNMVSKSAKHFSTKEKANEYILMNKPCLSINDVQYLKSICFSFWNTTLKELVKSKL